MRIRPLLRPKTLCYLFAALPALLAIPASTLAQQAGHPIRILHGDRGAEVGNNSAADGGSPELRFLLDRVVLGSPVTPPGMPHVSVYPLIARRDPAASHHNLFFDPGYLSLDESLRQGLLRISEKPAAVVPGLEVENVGDRPVLILAGEILVGGKQNRILQSDVLLPAHSGRRDVRAFCVEHGRWTPGEKEFRASGAMAPAPVRQSAAGKTAEAQSDVWRSIAILGRAASPAAASPTQSLHDVLKDPKVAAESAARASGLRVSLPEGTVGMIAVANGTIYSVDLFSSTVLFGKYVEKLARAAVTGAPEPVYYKGITNPDIEGFLRAAREANASYSGTAGLGTRVELEGSGVHGEALVVERRIVHTALFLW